VNRNLGRLGLQFVLALGSLIATACFAGAPLDTLRDCAGTASQAVYGLKDLAAVCPELEAALGTLGFDKILYEGWRDKLTVHALRDLISLSDRYSDPKWRGAPDTSALPGILQALKDEQAPQVISWWHAFKNWFKNWFDHSDSALAKWLKHFFENVLDTTNIPPAFLQAFVYIVTILTGLAALIVMVREFKAAGIGARLRRIRSDINRNPSAVAPTDEGGRPDQDTPAGLLRALVKRLLQTGRLAVERSLTHRELIARTSFDSDAQKAMFANIARTAEMILYGSQSIAPESLETTTRQGRELLRQLSETASSA
jgi:hypothetical protein